MAFAKNTFATGGSTSWADDDDFDDSPIPLATSTLTHVEENEVQSLRNETHRHDDARREYDDRRPRRHEYGHREDRGHHHHNDRRRNGDYEHEQREHRPKNPIPEAKPFKIYVGNLPFHATENAIADFIGDHDTIEHIFLPFDRANDRIKGFAYVEFRSREALAQALTLDGRDFDGRAVNMDVASERKPRQNDSFYDKRSNTRGYAREEAPKERPRLVIKPRTTSGDTEGQHTEATPSNKPNPFGEAKARDENAYLERRKSKELEEAAKKLAKTTVRDRKQSQEGEGEGDASVNGGRGHHGRGGRGGRGGRETEGDRWEREPQKAGRGRGRSDSNKQSAEPVPEEPKKSEEGRESAGGRGGRGGRGRGHESGRGRARRPSQSGRTSEEAPKTNSKPEIKPREPPKVNLKLAGTKTKNLFATLDDDSDSD